MLFSYEKKIIIRYLRIKYEHCDTRISSDHPEYEWDVSGGKKLLKKNERQVTLLEKKVRTEENIELIEEILLSQEDQSGAHPTPADIAREPNIYRRSVSCVIDPELLFHPLRTRKVEKFADLNL